MAIAGRIGREEAIRRLKIIPRILKKVKICTVSLGNAAAKRDVPVKVEAVSSSIVDAGCPAEGITEKEERLADFLEAAQEENPIADEVAEEQANATEPYDDVGEEKAKRGRRGRRGRRGKGRAE
ncbi:MAG: hypothetical protein J6Q22_09350 [Prevotella sp.]|nr:hypothetical protein [Prevotella sp.]